MGIFTLKRLSIKWNVYHLWDTHFITHWWWVWLMGTRLKKLGRMPLSLPTDNMYPHLWTSKHLCIFFLQCQVQTIRRGFLIHLVSAVEQESFVQTTFSGPQRNRNISVLGLVPGLLLGCKDQTS